MKVRKRTYSTRPHCHGTTIHSFRQRRTLHESRHFGLHDFNKAIIDWRKHDKTLQPNTILAAVLKCASECQIHHL